MSKRNREVAVEVVAVVTPEVETAPKGTFVKMNGVVYPFGERNPLKRAHEGVAVTIDGEAGTAVIIPARNFSDTRVWITVGGKVGRFLVPAGTEVAGAKIEATTETVKYDREAVRTKVETRVKTAGIEIPVEGEVAVEDTVAIIAE